MTLLCVVCAVLLLAGSARAATYGSNGFNGSAEGWTVKSATCSIPLLKTTVVTESPDFKVGDGGNWALRLQRQFVPGALLSLAPTATYTVALIDKTAGVESKSFSEVISAESVSRQRRSSGPGRRAPTRSGSPPRSPRRSSVSPSAPPAPASTTSLWSAREPTPTTTATAVTGATEGKAAMAAKGTAASPTSACCR